MKIIFAGTPEFAAASLDALITAGHEVVLVLTQPDRPAGRGMKLQASPVKQRAEKSGIPVYQPEKLRSPESWAAIQATEADLMVVVAYGIILPQAVLDIPRLGCFNVHASLLPRWRGAAPIHRAIEAGDAETGVCIMQMDAGLDTGPVLSRTALPIALAETTATLHDKLAALGAELLCQTLANPLPEPVAQSEVGVTYAHKIAKAESRIDWEKSAVEIDRQIRAFNPFPAASFVWGEQLFKVWAAKPVEVLGVGVPGEVSHAGPDGLFVTCSKGSLMIQTLQPSNSRRMEIADYLAGHDIPAGTVFS
ncbi:MAG: hypothetical protein RIR18_188 [Pseudomonadota bacterium]|jgi:methionyl-tRNA formyltransferase